MDCIVNKSNLAIGIVNSKQGGRYVINSMLIDKDCTVVNNGVVLVKVSKAKSNSRYIVKSKHAVSISKRIGGKADSVVVKKVRNKNMVKVDVDSDMNESFVLNNYHIKYPNYNELIENSTKPENLKFSVDFNPGYMEQVCKLAKEFMFDDNGGHARVTLEYYREDKALVLKCTNAETGQEFTALIMGLKREGK